MYSISAADAAFNELKVWVDADSDGVSDGGELRTLADLGIVSMDLNAAAGQGTDQGNLLGLTSSYTLADGSSRDMADVWFAKQTSAEAGAATGSTAAATPQVQLGELLAEAPTDLLGEIAGEDAVAAAATAAPTAAATAATAAAAAAGEAAAADATALALAQHQISMDDLLRQQPLI